GKAGGCEKAKKEVASEKERRAGVEKDLEDRGADLKKQTEQANTLRKEIAGLKGAEKAALAAKTILVNEAVAPPDAKISDLPKFIGQALKDKQEADTFRTAVAETLDKNKILAKDNLDIPSL